METKPSFNKQVALLAISIIVLVGSTVSSFYIGNSNGFRMARKGWLKIPAASGTLAITYNEGSNTPTIAFSPLPGTPFFRTNEKWNSENNQEYLEYSIKSGIKHTLFNGTNVEIKVMSAACIAQATPNFWDCTYRPLGERSNINMTVEVNPRSGDWRSTQ